MAKRLNKNEYKELFKLYETCEINVFWEIYFTKRQYTKKQRSNRRFKNIFKTKYKKWLKYGDIIFYDTAEISRKHMMKYNARKKITWDDFTREELVEIAERYYEIQKEKDKKERMHEKNNIKKCSVSKIAYIFNLSSSGIRKNLKCNNIKKSKRNLEWEKIIKTSFIDNNRIYGRKRLHEYIKIKFNMSINERTIGNYMQALDLKCKIRVARKKSEMKSNFSYPNISQRDYQNPNIYATDVSYIKHKSRLDSFAYLSILINHNTKFIEGWSLSTSNDQELIANTISAVDRKNIIIHSDHGVQYTSKWYKNFCDDRNWKISMSRKGNCLDNREAEYFFSILKSEHLKHINLNDVSLDKLKQEIAKFISWYNNERIQSVLNWKTPNEVRGNATL